MEAEVRRTRHVESVVEQGVDLASVTSIQRDLGPPLQGDRLTGRGTDGVMHPRARGKVGVCLVEAAGQQHRLSPERGRERLAARGAQPLGFRSERVRERDHLPVRPSAVEEPFRDAQLAVEHGDRQLGKRIRLPQPRLQRARQVASGMRHRRLGP